MTALAPAVLLGAAVLLAAGAGFGGLSSLGQVAGGPSLPAVEQSVPAAGGSGDSSAAQAPVAALAAPAPGAAAGSGGGSPAGQGGAGAPPARANAPVGSPQTQTPRNPGTRTPAGTPAPGTTPTAPSNGSPAPPAQTAPVTPQTPSTPLVPPTPAPVQQLLDLPRELPAPVGPITDRLLEPLTGSLPR